ncbi:CD82 antigen [Gastrophryne carolinensis]
MASGGCMKVMKYFLFLFNLLFFILGAVILGFGIWILVDSTSFIAVLQNSSLVKTGSYILIAVGGLTMIMGFLGCVGAVNEIRSLLGLYFAFLLLILIAQIVVGVLIYFQREELKSQMSDSIIKDLIIFYNPNDSSNSSAEGTWDYIQQNLHCCGWASYQIWSQNEIINNRTDYYPCTCVTNSTQNTGFCNATVANLYPTGCEKGVESWLQDNLGIILGVCVGVAVIELMGLILSICLCRNVHNEDYTKVPKY